MTHINLTQNKSNFVSPIKTYFLEYYLELTKNHYLLNSFQSFLSFCLLKFLLDYKIHDTV